MPGQAFGAEVLCHTMPIPTECEAAEAFASNNLSLLDSTRVEQIRQFSHAIRSCDSEAARYRLCLDKRDELLEKQDELLGKRLRLHIEFAFYEPAFTASTTYTATRETDKTWQKFASDAASGRKSQTRWKAELESAAKSWGEELVQHYAGERGVGFAVELARAARTHPDWKTNALPRLQQLACRRIQLIGKHGRHSFMHALERIDLINARAWDANESYIKRQDPDQVSLPVSMLGKEELPYGYDFDRYGLIVPKAIGNDESRQPTGSTVDPITIDMDQTKQSTSGAATEEEPGTRNAGKDATDTTSLSIIDNAGDVANLSSSSQQVEHTNTDGPCRSMFGVGAVEVENEGSSSPPTYGPITPRKSARLMTKKRVSQDAEIIPESTSSWPRVSRRKSGSHQRRPIESKAQHDAAVRISTTQRVNELKALAGSLPAVLSSYALNSTMTSPIGFKRKRAASLPPATSHDYNLPQPSVDNPGSDMDLTPVHDLQTCLMTSRGLDDAFLAQAKMELSETAAGSSISRGVQTALRLLPILQHVKHPNADDKKGPIEVYRLSGQQAKEFLSTKTPNVPIVTEQQQHFRWKDPTQPLAEFFEWMEDLDRLVSVQIPSLAAHRNSYERHSLRQVRKRFLSDSRSNDPWNILDCSCPLPSTLPDFLTSWNCQLLSRIREMVLNADAAERAVASREDWAEWRDAEHWVLLSEGGHCTAPHIDSHGLATWITVQEGEFGFTWMSRPTDEQHTRWTEDPEHYDEEQQWRFLVLRPGQTIFFPSGIIHGVFRVQDVKTLALGGHILQWTGVDQWADMISKQAMNPDSTNEEISNIWKWVPIVEELLRKRLQRS